MEMRFFFFLHFTLKLVAFVTLVVCVCSFSLHAVFCFISFLHCFGFVFSLLCPLVVSRHGHFQVPWLKTPQQFKIVVRCLEQPLWQCTVGTASWC